MPRKKPLRRATTIRTLSGRTIERSSIGRRTRAKARRGKTPIVGTVASGGGPRTTPSTEEQRRLGEGETMRKGLPQRRPVGRRT